MLVRKTTMPRSAVMALLAVGLAACSEGVTAPSSPTFDPAEALFAKGGGSGTGGSSTSGAAKDSGSRTFTIRPGASVYEKFGEHILYMPANVVCDPATSGYGPAYWDLPCERLKQPIQVTATWATLGGRPVISFSPDLRFGAAKQERDWVTLSLRDSKDIDVNLYYTILWYDKEAGRWVDESQTDPTLVARKEHVGNLVTRRLKHFSDWWLWSGYGGYNVTSGLGGDSRTR